MLIVKYTHTFFDLLLTLVLPHCWDNIPIKVTEEERVPIVAHSSWGTQSITVERTRASDACLVPLLLHSEMMV